MTERANRPEGDRAIDLSVEVVGTPEQVWEAIATGPGISSWYVPHTFEERAGSAATASFGEGPEMQISGRVAAWEPPHRIVFDKGEGEGGLAFEWLVEARDGGSCIVRLVNTGFGSGEEWDAQFDAMEEGWRMFLRNLQLHLEHFAGQHGTSMLPMAMWPGSREQIWQRLAETLGFPADAKPGDRIEAAGQATPPLSGTIVDAAPLRRLAILLDSPAPGTAFVAVESYGEMFGVSVWQYLYGPDALSITARDRPRWQTWLNDNGTAP